MEDIYIPTEVEYHPSTTLQKVINAGMVPGIAINSGISVETVLEMLRIVKKVLIMSVNPGNAGQIMDFEIYWDGACSSDKTLDMFYDYFRIILSDHFSR